MPERPSPYRREGEHGLIEIKLSTIQQLYATLDPAPFFEKDLDADAEEYILGAAQDLGFRAPIKLVFYLPPDQAESAEARDIERSIHNYFAYRLWAGERELRGLMRNGWIWLVVGLAFLAVCITARQFVLTFEPEPVAHVVAEGLLLVGWVAMWRPLQTFLYDWWPIRRRCRTLAALSTTPVEIRPSEADVL
jgi:hypothetical protein